MEYNYTVGYFNTPAILGLTANPALPLLRFVAAKITRYLPKLLQRCIQVANDLGRQQLQGRQVLEILDGVRALLVVALPFIPSPSGRGLG